MNAHALKTRGSSLVATARFMPNQPGILQRKCACGGTRGPAGECGECRRKRQLGIKTKLRINQPGDKYEQEADRMADDIMRMRLLHDEASKDHDRKNDEQRFERPLQISSIPRQPQRQTEEQKQDPEWLQANAFQIDAPRSNGSPLTQATRAFFEPRFGRDLSAVRVHTDAGAAEAARSVSARAFTLGRNVMFARGQYAPETAAGRQLLAHELTHTIQQEHAQAIQRKAEFKPCKPFAILDLARGWIEHTRGEMRVFGWTEPKLNGRAFPYPDGRAVAEAAVRRPVLGRKTGPDGEEIWVEKVRDNDGGCRELVPTIGPWRAVTEDFRKLLKKRAVPDCEFADEEPQQVLVQIVGEPDSESYRQEVIEHEDRHVRDDKKAFDIAFEQWDANLERAEESGMRFPSEETLYWQMGGTPEEIAGTYYDWFVHLGKKFHREENKASDIRDFNWQKNCSELHAKVTRVSRS